MRELDRFVRQNLRTVVELERHIYAQFSPPERAIHRFILKLSRLWFFFVHVTGVAAWVYFNGTAAVPLDPYPHDGLILFLGAEAVFLTLLVLINQRLMQQLDEHRAHLTLQIDLLNEQETTKALDLLRRVAERLEVKPDAETMAMAQDTNPEHVSEEIQRVSQRDPSRPGKP